ncbi:hypothetical protein CEXT_718181 [Caerostris extrusa]|uniref:Uncharacterized protein n=1 Tax=Caerostris extrusa TaxID=172846 RepID=A0AAV4SHU5_CAEEX|nr:hypothetical protein CEXT_718181 [Caerostris extrusa]
MPIYHRNPPRLPSIYIWMQKLKTQECCAWEKLQLTIDIESTMQKKCRRRPDTVCPSDEFTSRVWKRFIAITIGYDSLNTQTLQSDHERDSHQFNLLVSLATYVDI